ncbi:MAG: glycosyltransferase family 1 protein [Candidatus Acidoferrales bacterium]
MRIGLLTDNLARNPWSGVGSYARNLVREWAGQHEVWSIGSLGWDLSLGFAGHIRVARWQPGWRRRIESRTDVLHCPQPTLARKYFYELRKPRVVTIHGAEPFIFAGTPYSHLPDEGTLRLRERSDAVELFIGVSRSGQEQIAEHYGIAKERIVPIYHGIDEETFRPPADKTAVRERVRGRYGIPARYLLHVSNYRPRKNGPRIVAAYRQLWRQGFRDISLVLAGGPRRGFEAVREEIGRTEEGEVIHVGKISTQELVELYQGAEVFLFPSLHEGFGFPAIESMACGVPVVASTVYSLPEVTGGGAELVDPESVEAIAAATARLLRDVTIYEERRRAGLARSREFRWDVSAREHVEVFQRAIEMFGTKAKAS